MRSLAASAHPRSPDRRSIMIRSTAAVVPTHIQARSAQTPAKNRRQHPTTDVLAATEPTRTLATHPGTPARPVTHYSRSDVATDAWLRTVVHEAIHALGLDISGETSPYVAGGEAATKNGGSPSGNRRRLLR